MPDIFKCMYIERSFHAPCEDRSFFNILRSVNSFLDAVNCEIFLTSNQLEYIKKIYDKIEKCTPYEAMFKSFK